MIRIKKQQSNQQKTSTNKKIFIAFENERDNIGRIIKPKGVKKNDCNIMQLFQQNQKIMQNLKKSTKQYYFDKEFEKMSRKFSNLKKSLSLEDNRDKNYEIQVNKCLDIANKMMATQAQSQKNKQNLFINLREKINKKIHWVTSSLQKYHRNMRANTNTPQSPKSKQRNRECSKTDNNFFHCKKMITEQKSQEILKQVQKQEEQNEMKEQRENRKRSINVQLFKSLSSRSGMMATFCQTGLKYKQLVENKKFHPWKKWYNKYEIQVFPGKKVQIRSLKKSIYS